MTVHKTKRSKVVEAVQRGDYIEAMKLVKGFYIELTSEEEKIVRRAYEMSWNPSFYEQLGFNREVEFNRAVEILKSKYGA